MRAIIGLGNPGIRYADTRHNTGFEVIDNLNDDHLISKESFKLNKRLLAEISVANYVSDSKEGKSAQQILLAKPAIYMNDSGKAVVAIKNFYKLTLNDLLIIHDDISLPLGKIRLQKAGGAGGQHGVESIIECLGGEKSFNRLKIGIGPDPGGDGRINYVLQKFSDDELILLRKVIKVASEAVFSWLKQGIDQCMNEFNGIDLRLSTTKLI